MLAFLIALLFAVGQILLTEQLIYAVKNQDKQRLFAFLAAKFVLYGIGIGLTVVKGFWHLDMLFCGFVSGAPLMALGLYIYRAILKK